MHSGHGGYLKSGKGLAVAVVVALQAALHGGFDGCAVLLLAFAFGLAVEEGAGFGPAAYLAAPGSEPTEIIEDRQRDWLQTEGLSNALATLDERSRNIVQSRWLRDEDEGGSRTLQDLANEYGVSAERIRQIEAQAMKKMKAALASYA